MRFLFYGLLACGLCAVPATAQTAFPGLTGLTFTEADTVYTLSVTEGFSGLGLDVTPADLSFRFTPGAGSDDYQLALYGSATATFGETALTVAFGDSDAPGITATGTMLDAFAATLSGSFTHQALGFSVEDAGLQWQQTEDEVGIFGTFTVTFDGESLTAVMGSEDAPGLVLDNGTVTALSLDLPNEISLKGLPITPTDLGLAWTGADDAFALWGSATLDLDGSAWTVTVGDADDPGVSIQNGAITALSMDVSGSLDLDGFSATAENLTVAWDAAEDDVELSGTGTIALDGQTLSFTLGDADDPGVSIQNGALQDLDLSLSGTLEAAGMSLEIDALTLIESGSDFFEAYGSVTVEVGGKTMTLALGDADNPGMTFDQGNLTQFNASVTGEIKAEAVDFTMDGLTVQWDDGGDFEFYGTATADLDGHTVTISAGDADDPGLKLHSGSLQHLNVGVTADFTLHGVGIAPNGLTLEWDSGASKFFMYGELDVTFAGDTVDALLGDADTPGFTLHNGAITEVNIGITSDLKVEGLELKTQALTFAWKGGSTYDLYGEADLHVDGSNLDADFGDASNPGIQIHSGNLHSLSVDINSDLKLGNLEVETKDLTVDYSSSQFIVSGEITITEVFELDVTLGTSSAPGLEIDVSGSSPRFKIEDLTISLKHADLGGIDIKNITLAFTSSGIKDAEVDVAFPGGAELDGKIAFTGNPAKIDDVTVSYRADNLSSAVELFEGVQIAYLSGSVKNLTKSRRVIYPFGAFRRYKVTRSPYVSATIQTIYGGGVTFGGHSATFLEMSDDLTIYDFGLTFDASVNVGAYRTSSNGNSWNHVLGTGSVGVTLDYGHYGYLTASVSLPFVTANASVFTDSHRDFDALVDVHFCFPHGYWPVSGKCFGSIDGAVRYKHGYPYSSYGAGWLRVKTFWHTYHPGGKYNFGHRSFSFSLDLNSGSIESDIHRDESLGKGPTAGETYTQMTNTFTITDDDAHSVLVRMNWHEVVDTAYVTVVGPDGYHELMEVFVTDDNDDVEPPDYGTATNLDLVTSDSLANFFVTAATVIDTTDAVNETLLPGTYTVYLSYTGDAAYDLDLSVQPFVDEGEITLAATKGDDERAVTLDLDYFSLRPDSTTISWYHADTLAYTGKLIERQDSTDLFDDGQHGATEITFQPDPLTVVDTLWFYAVLDDEANPMQYSEIVGPIIFAPDLRGTAVDAVAEDSIAMGSLIYVDENGDGHWDTESTGSLEPHDIIDHEGSFGMTGLTAGTHLLRVLLPDGYRLANATEGTDGISITYTGQPLVVDLTIEAIE